MPKEGPSEDDETSAYKPPEAGLTVQYWGLGFIGFRAISGAYSGYQLATWICIGISRVLWELCRDV